jgi:hypothetical protein
MKYFDLFTPIVTLITAQITVMDLAQFRIKTKKLLLILGIELILQVAVNFLIFIHGGIELYARYYFFTMDLPCILTFAFVAKRRNFCDLFTVLITIFISGIVAMPCMWGEQIFGFSIRWYNLLRVLAFSIVFLFLHFIVRKYYMRLQDEIEKGWGIFSILPFIGSGFMYYKFWQYSMNGDFVSTLTDCSIIIFIMGSVFFVFFYIFRLLHEKYVVQEQKRILSMQNKAQHDQFEQQKEAAEKTNRRWHDMRHHTRELIELLEQGNNEAALTYLKAQVGNDRVSQDQFCMHPAVNSILSLWTERSKMAGIRIDIRTDIPEQLEIEPMELSALFANAFENAYESCIGLANDIQKYIKVEAHYNGRRLGIGFTNSCRKDIRFEDGMPVSSKTGGGIGTRSITYTVKRFHGVSYFEAKDNQFIARFILNV